MNMSAKEFKKMAIDCGYANSTKAHNFIVFCEERGKTIFTENDLIDVYRFETCIRSHDGGYHGGNYGYDDHQDTIVRQYRKGLLRMR